MQHYCYDFIISFDGDKNPLIFNHIITSEDLMSQDKPSKQPNKLIHWADFAADRIIRQNGDKESYTLASGITPSGVVHFGNFETITVDLWPEHSGLEAKM